MGPKKLIKAFYNAHVIEDPDIVSRFFGKEIILTWHSSEGCVTMGFDALDQFFKEINKTYADLRAEVTHIIKEDHHVAVRSTYYARTIENPDEELAISHFIAIWEVSDNKIIKGSMMSQPASAPMWHPG